MKKILIFSLTILITMFIACNNEPLNNNKVINEPYGPKFSGSGNPYEWVGNWHNECLSFVYGNCFLNYELKVWPDDSLINYLTYISDSLFLARNPNQEYNNINQDTNAYFFIKNFNNLDSLLLRLYNEIHNSNLTEKDKYYGIKIFNLALLGLDSLYQDIEVFQDSLYALEAEILSENWNNNEVFSLMSISLIKRSFEYHNNYQLNLSKNDKINVSEQDKEGFKKITSTVIDYSTGAGYFLSVTAGTGGVGTIAALSSASTVGAICSSTAKAIGGILGLWDISWDDINPFS